MSGSGQSAWVRLPPRAEVAGRLTNGGFRETPTVVRIADLGRDETVRFSGERSPKQTYRLRLDYGTLDRHRPQDQTFGLASIAAAELNIRPCRKRMLPA